MVRKSPARLLDFGQDAGSVAQVEHRHAEHFPVGVAGMRIVGGLDADGAVLVEAVLDLFGDLFVGQVGQEGKRTLGDAHDGSLKSVRKCSGVFSSATASA
ncbi:hypothetical protein IMCC9480_1995 [Oxalobacteraceae bacterium IMCC9480]|nr:hypothetical protein IMCC9480_1995 [Oxalobacteraceae bacterium IMCC9480]